MNRTLKILAISLMAIVVLCMSSNSVFAANDPSSVVDSIQQGIVTDTGTASQLTQLAGKIVGLIQIASAVAAVVLIALFGFKFIMGSANEKADYQKSFIPLIVGVVVVFASTSIAKLLFSTFAS